MDTIGISQSSSSTAMAVIGGVEVLSRAITSYFGDYFKGYMLHAYTVCAFILSITNVIGYFATTFTHFIIYGVGKYSGIR